MPGEPAVCSSEPPQTPPLQPGEDVLAHHAQLREESILLRQVVAGCRQERGALPGLLGGTPGVP